MPVFIKKHLIYTSAFLLLIYYFLLFSKKILLVTSDLGRHIKNGEYVFKDLNVLYTNFYSYTQPGFEFINHHWLFGVYAYFTQSIGGFVLLSVFSALIYSSSIILSYVYLAKNKGIAFAFSILFFISPLFSLRTEVRPEAFSILFLSIYILISLSYIGNKINITKTYLILILLQVIWVNTHIFFILGLGVIGFLFVHLLANKDKRYKKIFILGFLLILASLINPFFYKGLLAPMNIFKEYGYMIVENQSILFMHKRFLKFEYIYYDIVLLIALIIGLFNIKNLKKDLFLYFVLIMGVILSLKFNRAIPIFALCVTYFLNLSILNKQKITKLIKPTFMALMVIILSLFALPTPFSVLSKKGFGYGVFNQANGSAQFIKQNNIGGNIFNNYDIGGFLIYTQFNNHRVFVDNRPEAYSSDFLQNTYIKMQEDDAFWEQKRNEFDINTIYFYRLDYTPWAQPFLIRRLQEQAWIPVYVDDYTIIMLYENEKNKDVINKYKIPKEVFITVKN